MNRSWALVGATLGLLCFACSSSPDEDHLTGPGAQPDGPPPADAGAPSPAFPGARGWGSDATGGRGGEVRKVTNLNDSGAGSLRAALETAGAAYVIFEVAGTIGYFGTVFSDNGTPVTVNFINNYHIAGPETSTSRYSIALNNGVTAYARGNINSKRPSASDPEWNAIGCESGCGTYMQKPAPTAWQSSMPFDFPLQQVATMSATAIRDGVIAGAGANLVKDAVDTRIFGDVLGGTGGFVDDPADMGGCPPLADMTAVPGDTDDDGMADAWETQSFGSLTTGPNDDMDGDGYTNLEEYLDHLAAGG